MNKAEIEKYKMLISTMPEDKKKEAIEMLKNALYEGNPLFEVNKFITKNANAYIVKDPNEIKDKDLSGYRVVMFDCNFNGVNVFSNCQEMRNTMNKAEIEKYKMLISTMSEDKAKEAIKMLKNALYEGDAVSETLSKVNNFVMQNANVYIVKDQDEIKDKDLSGYGAVIFDCLVRDVTDFSNCPKKMIFNKDVYFHRNDIEELPDLSESIVMGDFDYRWCMKAKSPLRLPFIVGELKEPLKGAPKQVGGAPKQVDEDFACSMIESLTSLEGAPKDEEKRKQQNINKASILHIKKFGNGGNGGM